MHKLTRRHVMATLTSSAVMLCPAILNAQTVDIDWGDIPTTTPVGQKTLLNVDAGPAQVDVYLDVPSSLLGHQKRRLWVRPCIRTTAAPTQKTTPAAVVSGLSIGAVTLPLTSGDNPSPSLIGAQRVLLHVSHNSSISLS